MDDTGMLFCWCWSFSWAYNNISNEWIMDMQWKIVDCVGSFILFNKMGKQIINDSEGKHISPEFYFEK